MFQSNILGVHSKLNLKKNESTHGDEIKRLADDDY